MTENKFFASRTIFDVSVQSDDVIIIVVVVIGYFRFLKSKDRNPIFKPKDRNPILKL